MRFRSRWQIGLILAGLTAVLAIACSRGANPSDPIRVGSKDFTEQLILGEMYAQVLEHNGFKVERKLNLGGTPVAQASLLRGEIDLYPEYTGTGLLTVLKQPVAENPEQVYQTVAQGYQQQFNLVWLHPAPMNNTQALVMTQAGAKQRGIQTISDLIAQASQLTLVGPPEFQAREDGLPGLQRVYGPFQFRQFLAIDPGLRYQALQQGKADVAVGFATDGEINAFDLVVLEDDQKLFPPYQVAPVVRQQTLATHAQLSQVLNALAPKLTNPVMQQLNYEVSGKQREPAAVAQAFLIQVGLIQP